MLKLKREKEESEFSRLIIEFGNTLYSFVVLVKTKYFFGIISNRENESDSEARLD